MSGFAAVTPQQPQTLLYSGPSNASPGTQIDIDPTTQSLFFGLISTTGGSFDVVITGNDSGWEYFNGIVTNSDWALCPVSGALDTSVSVSVIRHIGTPATITLSVIARQDPIVSYLAGIRSGFESNRFQPVVPFTGAGIFVPGNTGGLLVADTSASGSTSSLLAVPNAFQAYRIFRISMMIRAATATTEAFATVQTTTATSMALARLAGNGFCSYDETFAIPMDIQDGLSLVGNTASVPVNATVWYSVLNI